MQPMEPFWFTGAEKKQVKVSSSGHQISILPALSRQVPHPRRPPGRMGDDWSFRWNPNLFAASGYVVIMINPRGSTGYGQQFIDDINGDWGGRAFTDLMLGLDFAEISTNSSTPSASVL